MLDFSKVAKALKWVKGHQTPPHFYTAPHYPCWTIRGHEVDVMLGVPLEDIPRVLAAPDVHAWSALSAPYALRDEVHAILYFEEVVTPVLQWRLSNGK